MNMMILIVVAAVTVLVPTALVATFVTTKDTYQYARHYGTNGYSQEVQQKDVNDPSDVVAETGDAAAHFEPVSDWPQEL